MPVGRAGSCRGDAVAESLFAALENSMYDLRKWRTREEARNAAIRFIERRCSRHRPHSTIDNKVPGEVMDAFYERTKPAGAAVDQRACEGKMAA